ncbi:MAG: CbiX/SirB N-terminal domain-containing protein, partial [Nitrospinota bacterium]|nr:CbiX/SirB N-terminal domain-containing protein [Nitrospinota bacterium]
MGANGMKPAVILMGHGSRVRGASQGMEAVADQLRQEEEFMAVEVCHMSRRGPFFPEALKKLADMGAREIILIPYFLHMGLHMRLDIPEMMQAEAAAYPGVRLVLGKHLGYDESLAALVKKRIAESQGLEDVRQMKLDPRDKFPLPAGEKEFVAMDPDEAEKY